MYERHHDQSRSAFSRSEGFGHHRAKSHEDSTIQQALDKLEFDIQNARSNRQNEIQSKISGI